ncbi:MAG: hypothetical protein LBF58_00945 [Deltaproteobacteria bacterium]|jgi:predicted transposase YdaD|nr:hypothetical protein [Deltaproteobacteria bacterium]
MKKPHLWRDVAWKDALIGGGRDALAYLMPDLFSDMDTSKENFTVSGWELPVEGSDTDKGMKKTDIIMTVPMKDEELGSVIYLIEQQHDNDKNFATRILDSIVRLRRGRPDGRTTVIAIFTGDSEDMNYYEEIFYCMELTLKYRSLHLPSVSVEELRRDNRAFARVLYAGRMAHEIGDNIKLREKHAWELLNMADDNSYDRVQKKVILEFSRRIFFLKDPQISHELKEAYNMRFLPLQEASNQIALAEAREEGLEEGVELGLEKGLEKGVELGLKKGVEKGSEIVARKMLAEGIPVETIKKCTGFGESFILSLS